ncbi:MAG: bifunctional 3-hydroxydecanoyl-ACP dehydratase/trans-2-decenoyl-ACP isomerase [Proteobacteria bacterium]|nr:bifunctional 3-hydroxydecanoyl-ACP dehydratase/trans-2-decenoyl-ACP isomerase [Pseudomonadota bacterium]MBU4371214.1 bifunctional 3-hydroxydecanoyl-ACP dehydratase/trans-2-decenoyl-ACP isomerase [Pseudomonadota bacterium]MBU4580913.1 bifunctional 3-hydroxydecanoyl-ACP dehydratase/trans-2-decenoyl-ACP isomerase [Pseudomonadota bacterium]MCG2741771.1 bifunctional 3-hydroxydecanoyl-ACP dehydratase/trans-2-decenoyl-ACP isomerase [Syntrophaceae bacterium]
MTYDEFKGSSCFGMEELIAFAYGTLVEDPPEGFAARLPAPPFLMVDRILEIRSDGRQGRIVAEQDIRLDAWYFQCHMPGDPVQPGCLGVDAIWQLLGFFCIWRGALGSGRALGCGEVVFSGQIRPFNRCVRYEVDVRRFTNLKESGASIVIGEGTVSVDGETVAEIHGARTGVFRGIAYPDYPRRSANAVGGRMNG